MRIDGARRQKVKVGEMRTRIVQLAIVAAVVPALALTGCDPSDEPDRATPEATPDQAALESVLVDEQPEGTVLETRTTAEALGEGMLHPPPFVKITPAACAELLAAAAGDLNKLSGVVRWGQNRERRLLDALVATTPEPIDLERLRSTVGECRSGTVTVDFEGEVLTGSLELTEFPVPELDGADAIGIQQTVTMDTDSELGRMFELNGTSSQIYLGMDNALLVACGDTQPVVLQNATTMHDRFQTLTR
jgi:hypothetical protein